MPTLNSVRSCWSFSIKLNYWYILCDLKSITQRIFIEKSQEIHKKAIYSLKMKSLRSLRGSSGLIPHYNSMSFSLRFYWDSSAEVPPWDLGTGSVPQIKVKSDHIFWKLLKENFQICVFFLPRWAVLEVITL